MIGAEFIKLAAKDAGLSLKEEKRCLLPGFRLPKFDEKFWRERGWKIEDYLPHCGIHPTAAAFWYCQGYAYRQEFSLYPL